MARQTWLDDVVADAFRGQRGFRVDVVSGWSNRGNTSFDPEGVMNHHTGPGSYTNLLNYMVYGSSISPLCNIATSRPENGIVRVTICNAGRANHAGVGELPWRRGEGSTGNRRTIGIENQNTGGQAWPDQQVEGIRILTAALLKHMNADTDRMLDHKTYTSRKVDRYATDVATERREVNKIMAGVVTTPEPEEEEDMPVLKWDDEGNDVRAIQRGVRNWLKARNTTVTDTHSGDVRIPNEDGRYGAYTRDAVAAFQQAANLSGRKGVVDGVCDSMTAAFLLRYDV